MYEWTTQFNCVDKRGDEKSVLSLNTLFSQEEKVCKLESSLICLGTKWFTKILCHIVVPVQVKIKLSLNPNQHKLTKICSFV